MLRADKEVEADLLAEAAAFNRTLADPEAQAAMRRFLEIGGQTADGELRLAELVGELSQARRLTGFDTSLKKSLPLSSTTMKAGKSTTSIFQTASMPSSGYSSTSTLVMLSLARRAAGPPIEPR